MDTPFVVQKYTCYFCVLGPEKPPTPYMSGTFVLAPPVWDKLLFLKVNCIFGINCAFLINCPFLGSIFRHPGEFVAILLSRFCLMRYSQNKNPGSGLVNRIFSCDPVRF